MAEIILICSFLPFKFVSFNMHCRCFIVREEDLTALTAVPYISVANEILVFTTEIIF